MTGTVAGAALCRVSRRRPALDAAERLAAEYPGARVSPFPIREGDGLEAEVGGESVVGTITDVEEWLAQAAHHVPVLAGSRPQGGGEVPERLPGDRQSGQPSAVFTVRAEVMPGDFA